jgi:hypothetical protein
MSSNRAARSLVLSLVLVGALATGCIIRETTPSTTPTAAPAATAPSTPQVCGQTAATAFYGPVQPGSQVVLGAHRPVAGDANWADAMGSYVSRTARVTELGGVDDAGCPGVRVDIDGGEWFWRIRDMQLVGAAPTPTAAPAAPAGIPMTCGMPSSGAYFGPIQVGTTVILGRHTPVAGDDNWAADMNVFVGQMATVTRMSGTDAAGCPGVRVDIDGGEWFWRIRDMQLASGIPQACGMASGSAYYGPVMPGSVLILGRHRPVSGDDNWTVDMNVFVGQTARVTTLAGTDASGCPGVRVDIDGGEWFWRIRDSQLVR